MHGQGNDYIFLDLEDSSHSVSSDQWRDLAVKLSNRVSGLGSEVSNISTNPNNPPYGVGSDGLVLIEKMPQKLDIYQTKMRIFNADGSEAEVCGTAQRCVAFYLYQKTGKRNVCIHTLAGNRLCTVENNNNVTTDMGFVEIEKKLSIKISGHVFTGYVVNVGNPHFVFITNSVLANNDSIWQKIENHEEFPKRINVENVTIVKNDEIKVRVWERGSGFTLACGSGACAAAFVGYKNYQLSEEINVKLPGGEVQVQIQLDDECFLTGKVEKIYETEIEI